VRNHFLKFTFSLKSLQPWRDSNPGLLPFPSLLSHRETVNFLWVQKQTRRCNCRWEIRVYGVTILCDFFPLSVKKLGV
jgi:hypothetical protein